MSKNKEGIVKKIATFIPEVRKEVTKVTWPTRKETGLTTAFVFVLAVIAAIYFFIVDQIAFKIIHYILGLSD
jgi:preprotein translocase subunit SecE